MKGICALARPWEPRRQKAGSDGALVNPKPRPGFGLHRLGWKAVWPSLEGLQFEAFPP